MNTSRALGCAALLLASTGALIACTTAAAMPTGPPPSSAMATPERMAMSLSSASVTGNALRLREPA